MKFIRIKASSSATVTATNSVDIYSALFKLILSGVTDPEAYFADPVCGQFCATSSMTLTHAGDTTIYPVVSNGAGDFTVEYGTFNIRCQARRVGSTSTHAAVFAFPYVTTPVYYYNTTVVTAPTVTGNFARYTDAPPATIIDFAKNHYLRFPKASTVMDTTVMIDVERGLVVIANDSNANHFAASRGLYTNIWQKSGPDSFFSASFLTNFTTFNTSFCMLDTVVGSRPFSLMTSIGPAATGFSGTTASDTAGVTIISRKQIAQATVKPVMGLRAFYSKDKEFDFSNAFLVADYDTTSEFVPTILNNGVTYDCLAHTLFARA